MVLNHWDKPLTLWWHCHTLNPVSNICSEIEDTVLLALQNPEVYDDIARRTRRKFETNRPRAILFEGPPGFPLVYFK